MSNKIKIPYMLKTNGEEWVVCHQGEVYADWQYLAYTGIMNYIGDRSFQTCLQCLKRNTYFPFAVIKLRNSDNNHRIAEHMVINDDDDMLIATLTMQ